eukprot:jgi/Botrbrau1/4345/Bobra.0232s0034.1
MSSTSVVPEGLLEFLEKQKELLLQNGPDEEVSHALKVLSETISNHQKVMDSILAEGQAPDLVQGDTGPDLNDVVDSLNKRLDTVSRAIDEADPTTLALLQGGLPCLLRDQQSSEGSETPALSQEMKTSPKE